MSIQARLQAAAAGLAKTPEAAAEAAAEILRLAPENPTATLILASALRRTGRAAEAYPLIRKLAAAHPNAAMTQYEFGEVLWATGDAAGAEAALARASTLEPTHGPAVRRRVEALIALGRYRDAERLAHGANTPPMRLLRAIALFRQQKTAAAHSEVDALLSRGPGDPAALNLKAACLAALGRDEEAIDLYRALLDGEPNRVDLWLNQAQALRTIGHRDEAIAAYRRAIALDPACGEAYWQLANLKVGAFTDQDVEALDALLRRDGLSEAERVNLNYALGRALEDRGEPRRAFACYAAGAAVQSARLAYDPRELDAFVSHARSVLTRDALTEPGGAGSPSNAPIFVVGLPRSGSTLVEQILASHSEVEGTMELPDIGLMARDLADERPGVPYNQTLLRLPPARLRELGERYLDTTAPLRALGRPRFVDKMPNNFLHVGLIALILPNARIVDVRRHPMATGFSVFKQHFATGQAFSYDLTHIGSYYAGYLALMRHFDAVLPGRVHRVIYEDLVDDAEGETRRLLDYCDLAFEPACLDFHSTRRAVRTVSSEQVRRPIFRDGLEQWRAYEPWLGPLKAALGPALDGWRT